MKNSADDLKAQVRMLLTTNNHLEAQQLCKKLCDLSPHDAEALFLTGVVYGKLEKYSLAETVLREALVLAPNHAGLYYNLGVALFQRNQFQQAMESFSRSVQIDPNQFDPWISLGRACEAAGASEYAIRSYGQAVALQPASEQALHALGSVYLSTENWAEAANIYGRLLELNSADPVYVNNFGIALSRAYQFERLINHIKPIAMRQPGEITPNYYMAMAHLELGEVEDALTFYRRVLDFHPDHPESIVGMASIYNFKGQYEKALETIRPLTRDKQDVPAVALAFAAIAPRFKLFKEAMELLELNLNSPQLNDYLKAKTSVALGNLYEKSGDFERAFEYIKRGNELNRTKFDRANHIKSLESVEALYSEESIAGMPVSGSESNQPIFIVGMPRSGTTLVEQILASHSQVFGAGELKYIQNYCFELHNMQINGKSFPYCLTDVSSEDLLRLSEDYLGHLNRLSDGAPRVTDKMPTNHLNLGLIYQLFPKAKVIHTKRDPMDTCLSCYFQFFSGAYPYTYDLDDLGFYYRSYERLMHLWAKVLPLAILDVSYEELVRNQEKMTRKILDFCELPWQQACMEFHKTDRAVATASTDQVRQPMNSAAIGKWRRYAGHLGDLINALEKY